MVHIGGESWCTIKDLQAPFLDLKAGHVEHLLSCIPTYRTEYISSPFTFVLVSSPALKNIIFLFFLTSQHYSATLDRTNSFTLALSSCIYEEAKSEYLQVEAVQRNPQPVVLPEQYNKLIIIIIINLYHTPA